MGAMTVTPDSKSFLPRQIPEGGRLATDLAGSTPTPPILASRVDMTTSRCALVTETYRKSSLVLVRRGSMSLGPGRSGGYRPRTR